MSENQVCPKLRSKMDVSAHLVMGWSRVIGKMRQGAFASALGVDVKTVKRAMCEDTVPELHTAMNSLLIDDTALNELFALYGFHPPRRREARPANDLHTMTGLSDVLREFCEALEDGDRDHNETLSLADRIRTIMPALTAILNEANRIKGVAA